MCSAVTLFSSLKRRINGEAIKALAVIPGRLAAPNYGAQLRT